MSRVLVTGAAGFLGATLAAALVARGCRVVGIDNFDPMYERGTKEDNLRPLAGHEAFAFRELDVRDTPALASLLDADTAVVHLAGRAGVRPSLVQPVEYADVNVGGTVSVAKAMLDAGATQLVFASSSSVYGNDAPTPFREDTPVLAPLSPYGGSKRAAEIMLGAMATGVLKVASLRFFTVYGPRQRPDLAMHVFGRLMLSGEPVTLFGDGASSREYTYVDDAVEGIVAAVRWTDAESTAVGLEAFNIGGGERIALRHLVEQLAAALGCQPRINWAPPQPGDVRHTQADGRKARAVLGFTPLTPFGDGLQRTAHWLRGRYGTQR